MVVRTRIKVCGITEPEAAAAAQAAGVDALGFIFAPQSPRRIEPEKAKEIIGSIPLFTDAVGVFVDEDPQVIEEIVQYCGLTVVQLHGTESPVVCSKLPFRKIKAFRVSPQTEAEELALYSGQVDSFLLDTYRQGIAGGTGETFDWGLVKKIAPPGPVILAGGLNPDNVAAAIRQVRPYAVDVNSGVESAPGCKDLEMICRFVQEVRRADMSLADCTGDHGNNSRQGE